MGYQQFDRNGNEIKHQDLQAKLQWCRDGEKLEAAFVEKFGTSLEITLNPQKARDPYAPDLLYKGKEPADLKSQNTPFFKAEKLYRIDPTYALVFNKKDALRYQKLYPKIILFFWIDWHSLKFKIGSSIYEVAPLKGVWTIPFKDLTKILNVAPLHEYQQRVNDQQGNAKSSYVLDIRNPLFLKVA